MKSEGIFQHWNSLEDHKNWRKHAVFTPGMRKAITTWLTQGYTVDYMCGAVDNYYWARTTPGSWWHDTCDRKWTIEEFFGGGKKKEIYNWKRFEPEYFEKKQLYTKEYLYKQRAREQQRSQQPEHVEDVVPIDWIERSKQDPTNAFARSMADRQHQRAKKAAEGGQ